MRFPQTLLPALALSAVLGAVPASAIVMVGGEPMYPARNIVENAVNSPDHTTLVAAVKAAGLVETLASGGPFTVFAPVNSAFAALPAGTVESLLEPANKGTLTTVLTYHVVPGALTAAELRNLIEANGGMAELTTAAGAKLTAKLNGPANVVIADATGATANIVTYDVLQSNGVIHVIDKVLLPQ
jgi:uncharacterized surface protein with fasciclin (FAS1) repeats